MDHLFSGSKNFWIADIYVQRRNQKLKYITSLPTSDNSVRGFEVFHTEFYLTNKFNFLPKITYTIYIMRFTQNLIPTHLSVTKCQIAQMVPRGPQINVTFIILNGAMVFFVYTMTDEYIISSPIVDKMFGFSKMEMSIPTSYNNRHKLKLIEQNDQIPYLVLVPAIHKIAQTFYFGSTLFNTFLFYGLMTNKSTYKNKIPILNFMYSKINKNNNYGYLFISILVPLNIHLEKSTLNEYSLDNSEVNNSCKLTPSCLCGLSSTICSKYSHNDSNVSLHACSKSISALKQKQIRLKDPFFVTIACSSFKDVMTKFAMIERHKLNILCINYKYIFMTQILSHTRILKLDITTKLYVANCQKLQSKFNGAL
ncbi:hypothetical protein AGLY_002501 [Aphis glycines]|uniref:Uncharacterized protein n=1 Tax=Aphis glycines TaxID=307491 RepID=A0A6G0U1D3_APHGL|nr:hypothetical protein AGLY_002501 [Aphis glycines]